MKSESFRAFIAVPLPAAAREALALTQRTLMAVAARNGLHLRWTALDHLHLTLKFLGSVPRTDEQAYIDLVERHAAMTAPMPAALTRVAVFGSPRRARVLHAELVEPSGRLSALADALDQDTEAFGIARETRPYSAHVTLARFKRPGNAEPLVNAEAIAPEPLVLEKIRLYESVPAAGGSHYTVLCEAPLRPRDA